MEHYSRKSRQTQYPHEEKKITGQHITKGLTAFQKLLATIGSLLGIITASITILTYLNKNKQENPAPTSQTTVIHQIEQNTDQGNPPASSVLQETIEDKTSADSSQVESSATSITNTPDTSSSSSVITDSPATTPTSGTE